MSEYDYQAGGWQSKGSIMADLELIWLCGRPVIYFLALYSLHHALLEGDYDVALSAGIVVGVGSMVWIMVFAVLYGMDVIL